MRFFLGQIGASDARVRLKKPGRTAVFSNIRAFHRAFLIPNFTLIVEGLLLAETRKTAQAGSTIFL